MYKKYVGQKKHEISIKESLRPFTIMFWFKTCSFNDPFSFPILFDYRRIPKHKPIIIVIVMLNDFFK